MKIAGFVKQSLVDYPGRIAASVFTQGCNMNCVFCHNRCLVGEGGKNGLIDTEYVFSFLQNRKRFLDGVVVTGGEPALQPDVDGFIKRVKDMGYPVKLDTNGTQPQVLKKLLDENLLDYIAMDIKAPMKKYHEICRSDINERALLESISLIMESGTEYEFRTTYCPQLNETDILEIGEMIHGAKKYVLQQYRETDLQRGGYTGKAYFAQLHGDFNRELRNYVSVFQVRGNIGIHAVTA